MSLAERIARERNIPRPGNTRLNKDRMRTLAMLDPFFFETSLVSLEFASVGEMHLAVRGYKKPLPFWAGNAILLEHNKEIAMTAFGKTGFFIGPFFFSEYKRERFAAMAFLRSEEAPGSYKTLERVEGATPQDVLFAETLLVYEAGLKTRVASESTVDLPPPVGQVRRLNFGSTLDVNLEFLSVWAQPLDPPEILQ